MTGFEYPLADDGDEIPRDLVTAVPDEDGMQLRTRRDGEWIWSDRPVISVYQYR